MVTRLEAAERARNGNFSRKSGRSVERGAWSVKRET
jgi:hypothetical protein